MNISQQWSSGYKSRVVHVNQSVDLYRNLNIDGVFSLRSSDKNLADKGKVIGHFKRVLLNIQDFPRCVKVSKAGQSRVKREGRKNVHATLGGRVVGVEHFELPAASKLVEITYCPYQYDSFVRVDNGEEWSVEGFQYLLFEDCKAFAIYVD